jgi:hypothetical protein
MVNIGPLFLDAVNGHIVHEYVDCYGQKFMAQTKFGMRVKK